MDRYLRVDALVSVRHTTVSMTNPTDRIEIITSVRRRWTASEKVRMVEEKGKVVFRHACLMGLEGIVSGARIEVSFRPVAGLAQVQEPGGARCGA